MNKWAIALLVAFGLALGFSLLQVAIQGLMVMSIAGGIGALTTVFAVIGLGLTIGILLATFVVFYFVSQKTGLQPDKATIAALIVGFMLGSTVLYIASAFIATGIIGRTNFLMYPTIIVSALASSFSTYFFTALAGLLYARFKEKKTDYSPPPEQTLTEPVIP